MAKLTDCSEPYCTEIQRRESKNHDRLMALHDTGLNIKRTLLKCYLLEKNLNLLEYISTWHDWNRFYDVKHAIRKAKNVTLEDLRLNTIDTLLTYHCYELFWKSCLVNTSVEEILNKYKEDLYNLYQTGGGCSNEYQGGKKKYLTKDQWAVIFKDQESEEAKNGTNDSKLKTPFVAKGLTVASFDNDTNFVILNTVCKLFKSVLVLTEYQTQISWIAIDHEVQSEAFDKIWMSMETNIKTISCHCKCEDRYNVMLDSIKTCIFGRLQAQANRKYVMESALDHPSFFQDVAFRESVIRELKLTKAEETQYAVRILCGRETTVVLPNGQYIEGSYPLAIFEATRKDLDLCQSICSKQTFDVKPQSSSVKVDVLGEQRKIDLHNYFKLVLLIKDVAKDVLVEVLKGRLPGADYGYALNGMKSRLVPLLNYSQVHLLYPDGDSKYTGDFSDIDVSLLYIILRNLGTICPHQNGWGKDPNVDDRSISANIDRIRIEKNVIVSHSSNCSVGTEEFNKIWGDMRQTCVDLGGQMFEEKIDTLLTLAFNFDLEQQLHEEIIKLKENDIQNIKNTRRLEEILDSIQQLFESFKKLLVISEKKTSTTSKAGSASHALTIKGKNLPTKSTTEDRLRHHTSEDICIHSIEDGSTIICLEIFPSALQSFGFFLGVIDKLLQTIFASGKGSETRFDMQIRIYIEMLKISEGRKYLTERNAETWCAPRRSTSKPSPDDQIKRLRLMFESVEQFLRSPDYDKDLQGELSAACPNYMNVFLTAKRDLLRNDYGVVVTGEMQAGTSTLLNQLVRKNVIPTSTLSCTKPFPILRIRDSEKMEIKCYLKDDTLIKEEEVQNLKTLRSIIGGRHDICNISDDLKNIHYVDVFLPVPILKGNVIIVNTPGFGYEILDNILLDCLLHAVSLVVVVNVTNFVMQGVVKLSRILQKIMNNREKMPFFDPSEIMILTNKWDMVYCDSDKEDQQIWNVIQRELTNSTGWLNVENVFRVSLKQVEQNVDSFFTEEYKRFETVLKEKKDKNENKRVEFYYRFLKDFIRNAEKGSLARLNLLDRSEEEQQRIIIESNAKIRDLEFKCKQSRIELESYKTEIISTLAEKLHAYLHSSRGREQILNPPGTTRIFEVANTSLTEEIPARVKNGIQQWCDGQEVKSVFDDADAKIRSLDKDIESKLKEIEIEMTGINTTSDNSTIQASLIELGLGLPFLPSSIVFTFVFPLDFSRIFKAWCLVIGVVGRRQTANDIYDECLTKISMSTLKASFEKSFGVEYGKIIVRIFDEWLPKVIESLRKTNTKLLEEHKSIKQNRDSLMRLKDNIQEIQVTTENFERNC